MTRKLPKNSERLWVNKMRAREIYDIINEKVPFSKQCDWDNSGILVACENKEVKKILTCTDITSEVSKYAVENDVDLVISHHPVIFKGLKTLDNKNPAVRLSNYGISAICCHTNVDRAEYGLNEYLCDMLGFDKVDGEVLGYDGGDSFGIICKADEVYTAEELAEKVKNTLGCDALRFCNTGNSIKKIGICTGSGGDFVEEAFDKCDALITGDVKHNHFIDAYNYGFTLIDAGHYHTEKIFTSYMKELLENAGVTAEIHTFETKPYEVI